MAAVVAGVSLYNTGNTATYTTGNVNQATNDLLVAFCSPTAEVSTDWVVSDSQGGTWTKVVRAVRTGSATFMELWVRDALCANATALTVTFSHAAGNATGCSINVLRISGMSRAGITAIRNSTQFGKQDNGAAAGTPAPALPVAALTGNPCVGAVGNSVNPAAMTAPASWTERFDSGYATPAAGMESVSIDSGFTGTTVTWGSTSGGTFCAIVAELDTSAAGAAEDPMPYVGGGYYG